MLNIFRKNFFRSLTAKFLHLFVIVLIKKEFICPRNTSNFFDRRFPSKLECRCSERSGFFNGSSLSAFAEIHSELRGIE